MKWWDEFKKKVKLNFRFEKPVSVGIDVNCQICESNVLQNWEFKLKGGAPPANITSMCACVTDLGMVFPAGEACKHANISEYGTYNPTIGNSSILLIKQAQ